MDIKQRGSVSVPVYAMVGMICSVRTQDSDEKAVLFQNDTMGPDGQVDVKIEAGDVVVIVYYESNTHDFSAGTRQGAPRPLSLLFSFCLSNSIRRRRELMQENVTYRRKVSHWEIRMGL